MTSIVTATPGQMPRVTASWLAVREAADAAARSAALVAELRRHLAGRRRLVVHDLGCGTGAAARWLAPRLPARQHWVLHDRDPLLLAEAAAHPPARARVTVTTREGDVTTLTPADLAGADVVTAAALTDLLTGDEVDRVVGACVGAGAATLVTLSVTGRVELAPADPLDTAIGAAFNAHQRRAVGARRLLGPDAVDAMVDAFDRRGVPVLLAPSPWRLGPGDPALLDGWLAGWIDAACEQEPALAGPVAAYAARRRAQLDRGELSATVHHLDVLALPGKGSRNPMARP